LKHFTTYQILLKLNIIHIRWKACNIEWLRLWWLWL